MIIADERAKTVYLKELEAGDVFTFMEHYYIMTSDFTGTELVVVDLENGRVYKFNDEVVVCPLIAKLSLN